MPNGIDKDKAQEALATLAELLTKEAGTQEDALPESVKKIADNIDEWKKIFDVLSPFFEKTR
jgi:hypothetical protein